MMIVTEPLLAISNPSSLHHSLKSILVEDGVWLEVWV